MEFQHAPVEDNYQKALEAATALVLGRIEQVLVAQGKTHTHLWSGLGMSESGYWRMLKNGTMDLRRLASMAAFLDVTVDVLLPAGAGTAPAGQSLNEPPPVYGKPKYLEDRMTYLETELRKVKERIRNH